MVYNARLERVVCRFESCLRYQNAEMSELVYEAVLKTAALLGLGVRFSFSAPHAPLAQLAEATVSKAVQSGFKSQEEYHIGSWM